MGQADFENKPTDFSNMTREQLRALSVASLLELLEKIDEGMTEDNFDERLIDDCLDILDEKSPTPEFTPAEETLRSLRQNAPARSASGNARPSVPKRAVRGLFRSGVTAAVLALCLISGVIAARASGVDVFGAIASWTDSILSFGNSDGSGEEQLSAGEAADYIRSWLPALYSAGFSSGEETVIGDDVSGALYYTVTLSGGGPDLVFTAQFLPSGFSGSIYEKDGTEVSELDIGGTRFYVFKNNDCSVAAWKAGGVEFSVMTLMGTGELRSIIETAYGGQ